MKKKKNTGNPRYERNVTEYKFEFVAKKLSARLSTRINERAVCIDYMNVSIQ